MKFQNKKIMKRNNQIQNLKRIKMKLIKNKILNKNILNKANIFRIIKYFSKKKLLL